MLLGVVRPARVGVIVHTAGTVLTQVCLATQETHDMDGVMQMHGTTPNTMSLIHSLQTPRLHISPLHSPTPPPSTSAYPHPRATTYQHAETNTHMPDSNGMLVLVDESNAEGFNNSLGYRQASRSQVLTLLPCLAWTDIL